MRRLTVLLALLFPLVVVGTGAGATQGTLTGQVIARGTGLGCLRESCWKPAPKVPVTILRDSRVVTRALSGPDGRFGVVLAPGVYTLRAPGLWVLSPDPVARASGSMQATVRAGRTTRLALVIAPRTTPVPGENMLR